VLQSGRGDLFNRNVMGVGRVQRSERLGIDTTVLHCRYSVSMVKVMSHVVHLPDSKSTEIAGENISS